MSEQPYSVSSLYDAHAHSNVLNLKVTEAVFDHIEFVPLMDGDHLLLSVPDDFDEHIPGVVEQVAIRSDPLDMFPMGPAIPIYRPDLPCPYIHPASTGEQPLHASFSTHSFIRQTEPTETPQSHPSKFTPTLAAFSMPERPLKEQPCLDLLQLKLKRKYDRYSFSKIEIDNNDDHETVALQSSRSIVPPPTMPSRSPAQDTSRAEFAIRAMQATKAAKASLATTGFTLGATQDQSAQSSFPYSTSDDFSGSGSFDTLFSENGPRKKSKRSHSSSAVFSAQATDTALPTTQNITTGTYALRLTTIAGRPSAAPSHPSVASRIVARSGTKTTTPYAKKTISNGTSRNAGYVPEFDDTFAPRETARLPQCKMSASEILCFFPRHTQWPDIMLRLIGNGWTSGTMADAILFHRGRLDLEHHTRRDAAQRRQVGNAGKEKYSNPAWKSGEATADELHPTSDYDVSQATPPARVKPESLHAVKLVDVARGIQQWPHREECGIVSKVLYFAHQNPAICGEFTTDDIQQVAVAQGFSEAAGASSQDWDQQCLARMGVATRAIKDRIAAERRQAKKDAKVKSEG
ncbi:hypothetical protein LTR86_008934 [Recurvomyces mirabilis]|nr:hypothetical protein LTR86_008934 [Recurvomyces mirabilis]